MYLLLILVLLDPARRYTCPVAGNYILNKYPNRPNTIYNTELNDFRTIVYLRKSEFTVEEFQFVMPLIGWLVGWFGFNGPLRQYFSLYRAASQREGERGDKDGRVNMSKQPPPAPTASAIGPCPTNIHIVGRPGTGSLPRAIAPPDNPRNAVENWWSTAYSLHSSYTNDVILMLPLQILRHVDIWVTSPT